MNERKSIITHYRDNINNVHICRRACVHKYRKVLVGVSNYNIMNKRKGKSD